MAKIEIGEAATAGFQIIARYPLAVLAWGAVIGGFSILLFLLFGPSLIHAIVTLAQTPSTATPDVRQIMGLFGGIIGFVLLLILGLAVLGTMVQAAVYRSEFEPDERRFAFLRLGSREFLVFASDFVLGVVLYIAQVVMSIPLVIVTLALTVGSLAAAGGNAHAAGSVTATMMETTGLRLVGQIVIAVVSAWLWLRLCLASVMTFRERKFRLFESWNLTRGHGGSMFLAGLLMYLIVFLAGLVFWIVAVAGFFATMAAHGGGDLKVYFSRSPELWLADFIPLAIVLAFISIPLSGFSNAMRWGMVARFDRQLSPESDPSTAFS